MIARLFISSSPDNIKKEIKNTLVVYLKDDSISHPDILYFEAGMKLGIAQARQIKKHFSLKPNSLKGKIAIIEEAEVLTLEAQNALLKTIEELPEEAILILGANSDAILLPTIISRCQVTHLQESGSPNLTGLFDIKDIEKLLNSSLQDRFGYIERLKEKELFLHFFVHSFRETLLKKQNLPVADKQIKNYLEELLQAEQWTKQNVNIRAILEYLMLVMPSRLC